MLRTRNWLTPQNCPVPYRSAAMRVDSPQVALAEIGEPDWSGRSHVEDFVDAPFDECAVMAVGRIRRAPR